MSRSLGSIEIEVLSLILEFIDDSSPKTTQAVALVSKHFYATTRLVAHRRKSLNYNLYSKGHRVDRTVDNWLQDADIVTGLRHLEIKGQEHYQFSSHGVNSDDEDEDDYTESEARDVAFRQSIGRLIAGLANLKILIWSTVLPISGDIVRALRANHPKAQLKIYNFRRPMSTSFDHTDENEIALSKSPQLTVLRGTLWPEYRFPHHVDLREPAFHRIVANAPNLKFVSIINNSDRGVYRIDPEIVSQQAEMKEQFYAHKRPNSSIRILTLDGYSMSRETLEGWSRIVDMSKLENLKFSRGLPDISYFQAAPNILPNLKHVSLNLSQTLGADLAAAASNYIETCAPLETLSLWGWAAIIPLSDLLRKHGQTLRTLQLHERETFDISRPRRLLSSDDLENIRNSCPRLEDLTLDMNRHDTELTTHGGDENTHKLQLLSTFPAPLNKIQIYFDAGVSSLTGQDNQPSDSDDESLRSANSNENDALPRHKRQKCQNIIPPPSTLEHIENYLPYVWRTIFGKRVTGIRELDIKFGEWERRENLGIEKHEKMYCKVRPGLRDDAVGENAYVMICQGERWDERRKASRS